MSRSQEKPARRSIGARRSVETEEAILQAAEEILEESGYAGFSIEAVARRAKAGKPTIYRWWRGKADLLLDAYHRQKKEIPIPDTGDLERDLAVFIGTLLEHWRTSPSGNTFRSVLAEAQHDEAAAEAVRDYALDRRAHIAQMVERARDRGEAAPDVDPNLVAELVISFVWTQLITHRWPDDDELRAVMRLIARGAKAEKAKEQKAAQANGSRSPARSSGF